MNIDVDDYDPNNIEELVLVLRKLGALSSILLSLTLLFFDLTWLCDLPIDIINNPFSSVPVFFTFLFGFLFGCIFFVLFFMSLYWVAYTTKISDLFERFWDWL